mgnify:CR=1 FL=1
MCIRDRFPCRHGLLLSDAEDLALGHDQTEEVHQRRVLDDADELVDEGWQDPPHALGHHDQSHRLAVAEPQGAGGLEPLAATANYGLRQNRPNPFNPTTVIEYVLPETEYLRLRVFDRHGREVAMLFEGTQEAGEHAVTFDAEQLPSGMYFYRLETARGIETKKMVLLR